MTERVRRDEGGAVSSSIPGGEFMPHANVTAEIVDRAVEQTLTEARVSPEVARVMRSLMVGDSASPVAKAYYHGVATSAGGLSTLGISRRSLDVPYVLRDEQVTALSEYAPDFQLRFSPRESHDHPMAAACRSVDRAVVGARLPPGASVSHVGGAVLPLVFSGQLGKGHHACMPLVDRKDASRHVLLNLRVRKIAATATLAAVRESASGYLAKERHFVCNQRVQHCDLKTPVLTSVHVYDVPMQDWSGIMDRKGAQLVEGCLLFPRDVFSRNSGEMTVAGARYELDAERNVFRMGFMGSPAWWYEHDLSDYLKYGVDQVLCSGGSVYSYKVVERRGDTLFFRIVKVAAHALPEYVQHYSVPGVQMVRVNGFPVDKPQANPMQWARRAYLFPAPLWEDMLTYAVEHVERGTLTHEKLFNYYRTVAPRQSINAVVVAGGSSVHDLNHLVPLVVHVALFAMLEVKRTKVESYHTTAAVMKTRDREAETTLYKVLAAFGQGLLGAVSLTCAPLMMIIKAIDRGIEGIASLSAYDWELEPVVQEVSAKLLLSRCFSSDNSVATDFSPEFASAAPHDLLASVGKNSALAKFTLNNFPQVIPTVVSDKWEVEPDARQESSVSKAVAPPETAVGTVETADVSEEEQLRRKNSILEAVVESRSEAKKVEASCADHFRELLQGSKPSASKLTSRKEMFFNPEFWKVVAGFIESSFSGVPVDNFQHAAVYCPVPCDGSRVVVVEEELYKGMSEGSYVERVHYRLANSTYTGWVYTNDALMIHNGPAIEKALLAAVKLPLDFYITLKQGPPGCGKTTTIVKSAKPTDVILVPVRKAVFDIKKRLKGMAGFTDEVSATRVRTLDSYLVNHERTRKMRGLKSDRLLADESFMAREGRWLAAAALLGVSWVDTLGDKQQIPHVPRAECPKNFVRIAPQREDVTYISYRCPPQSVACWGSVYDWTVRSASKVHGVVEHHASSAGLEVPFGCVMMGMYQADKKILAQKYANCPTKIEIMTVHESEGNTYPHVWLHRFDMRKRSDKFSLYDQEPYALVAMSRNTHTFRYIAPDLGDLVSSWIKRGKDARRVTAAAHLETAGESIEKL